MKILKTLSVSLLLTCAMVNNTSASEPVSAVVSLETPLKTICIKNPNASDPKFFSSTKGLFFEIYKPGTKEEKAKIISSLKSDPAVETVIEGAVTGDYHAITLVLKTEKSKDWYISEFKKAGLNTIKVNNNAIIEVEKL